MKYRRAAGFVSMSDIETFFTGESWPVTEVRGNEFYAESIWNFRVTLTHGPPKYEVKIGSPEDETDSDTIVTDDPVRAVKEFLTKGMSDRWDVGSISQPDDLCRVLRGLANSIDNSHRVSLSKTIRIMRRVRIIPFLHIAKASDEQIGDLIERMEDEGWEPKVSGRGGDTTIKGQIGDGTYDVEIRPESQIWNHKYEFIGNNDLTEEGESDDPIAVYNKWKKRQDLSDAWQDFKIKRAEKSGDPALGKTDPVLSETEPAPSSEKETAIGIPKKKR